jgi:hypothetical protein
MNWQSHAPVEFQGVSYGHKDMEFERFMDLPLRTKIPLEVAVAGKNTPHRGWFSDRSSAYLARPVIVQDTEFGTHLPCGEGSFAFRTAEGAVATLETVQGDFERHSRAARAIAAEYLDAPKVLRGLLAEACIA